jgi:hypothetical protein
MPAVIAIDPIVPVPSRAGFFAIAPEPPCRADHRRHEATTVRRGPVAAMAIAVGDDWRALEAPSLPSHDRWAF